MNKFIHILILLQTFVGISCHANTSNNSSLSSENIGSFHSSAIQIIKESRIDDQEIYLLDGTVWTLSQIDSLTVSDWQIEDRVILLPYDTKFSSAKYNMKNLQTSEVVAVSMKLGPTYGGIYSRHIIALNDYAHLVLLDDGVHWKVQSADAWKMRKWLPLDFVVIGVNSDCENSHYPNILINVSTLDIIRVKNNENKD